MEVNKISENDRWRIINFFKEHWGSGEMVISSGVYNCEEIDGFFVEENEKIIGLITYVNKIEEIEIISLDSILEKRGIGSLLILEVENLAKSIEINKVSLITTNDNLNALRFYQKRGYRIDEIFKGAVEKARNIKPTIPLIGDFGIPINDEIKLVKLL